MWRGEEADWMLCSDAGDGMLMCIPLMLHAAADVVRGVCFFLIVSMLSVFLMLICLRDREN